MGRNQNPTNSVSSLPVFKSSKYKRDMSSNRSIKAKDDVMHRFRKAIQTSKKGTSTSLEGIRHLSKYDRSDTGSLERAGVSLENSMSALSGLSQMNAMSSAEVSMVSQSRLMAKNPSVASISSSKNQSGVSMLAQRVRALQIECINFSNDTESLEQSYERMLEAHQLKSVSV